MAQTGYVGVANHLAVVPANAFEEPLMQRMHIQIGGIGFVHATPHAFRLQDRHLGAHLRRRQHLVLHTRALKQGHVCIQQSQLVWHGHHERPTPLHQRLIGKASGRSLKKSFAGQR